jgi:hypothetical protein
MRRRETGKGALAQTLRKAEISRREFDKRADEIL